LCVFVPAFGADGHGSPCGVSSAKRGVRYC
jgi:hypothetical protein